jgi:23S rRNA pseudouridine1911/1915/1917 synthase
MHRSERVVKRAAYPVDLDNPDDGARDRQQQSAAIPAMPPVLFEDGELLAVDKPAGLVTHPSYKHADGTLWDAVLARQLARGEQRPCLLHRLDKWTSGVMLFAKTASARRAIVRQFERRSVGKRYLALTAGMLDPDEGEIEAPLVRDSLDRRRTIVDEGGQPALTRYRVLAHATGYSLVLAEPQTGRTHQIRAHLSYRDAPLIGDARYLPEESPSWAARAMLHAWQLSILYPGTGTPMTITAPVPADFASAARHLGLGGALAALDTHQ